MVTSQVGSRINIPSMIIMEIGYFAVLLGGSESHEFRYTA